MDGERLGYIVFSSSRLQVSIYLGLFYYERADSVLLKTQTVLTFPSRVAYLVQ